MHFGSRPLRVVLVWRGEPLEERVFATPQADHRRRRRRTTPSSCRRRALGDRFPLFRPSADATGFVLTLADGHVAASCRSIASRAPSTTSCGAGAACRSARIASSRWRRATGASSGSTTPATSPSSSSSSRPALPVGPERGWFDRFFGQALAFAAVVHVALLAHRLVLRRASRRRARHRSAAVDGDRQDPARAARAEPEPEKPKAAAAQGARGGRLEARARQGRQDRQPRRQGRRDQDPQGRQGSDRREGLEHGPARRAQAGQAVRRRSRCCCPTRPTRPMTTAMAGLKGTELVIGKGSGGMSTRGEGPGGGGKGDGQLLGVGNLAVGGGGHGAHANGNGPRPRGQGAQGRRADRHAQRRRRPVQGADPQGRAVARGGDPVLLREGAAALPAPVGQGRASTGRSTSTGASRRPRSTARRSATRAPRAAWSRQVKNWQFPKPNGVICNVSFPFFFKGQ